MKLMTKSKSRLSTLVTSFFALAGVGILLVTITYAIALNKLELPAILTIIFTALMAGDALLFFLVSWGLSKRARWSSTLGYILIAINIFAFIFDDFGLVDALATLFMLFLGVLIYINNKKE